MEFGRPQSQLLEIKNTGQVSETPCVSSLLFLCGHLDLFKLLAESFHFHSNSQVKALYAFVTTHREHPRWLWMDPGPGSVAPGGTVQVRLTVNCDVSSMAKLNRNEAAIDEVLVLHLENGKDYFISLTGTFVPTCLCRTLDDLVRTPQPVR